MDVEIWFIINTTGGCKMNDNELYELFHSKYRYEDGQLISKLTGQAIKNKATRYLKCELKINGKTHNFRVHRVIFLMHHGYLPTIVDHIDRDIYNNRIENLRAASHSQNSQNRGAQSNNKLGVKGVCLNTSNNAKSKPYAAFIKANGKRYRIGSFETIEEASRAYNDHASLHFGEFKSS
jgi:hypothetical protein